MGSGRDAHKGIRGAHALANGLSFGICPKAIAQESNIALIDLLDAADRRGGISEGFRGDALWGEDAWCRMHVRDRILDARPITILSLLRAVSNIRKMTVHDQSILRLVN